MTIRDFDLQDVLRKIDGHSCPDFFLTGTSYSSLERAALELADGIEQRKLISFMGTKQKFSIIMPYFSDQQSAKSFVRRLGESVSIARDCYYQFRGIVIIECDREWSKKGSNSSMQIVFDYLKRHDEICFIVLAVDDGGSKEHINTIYNGLCSVDFWLPVNIESYTPEECVDCIEATAKRSGLNIPESVKESLVQIFRNRDETDVSNQEIAEKLIRQILLRREVNPNYSPEIDISEISYLGGASKPHSSGRIGFVANNR